MKLIEKLVRDLERNGYSTDSAYSVAAGMLQKSGMLTRKGRQLTRKGRAAKSKRKFKNVGFR